MFQRGSKPFPYMSREKLAVEKRKKLQERDRLKPDKRVERQVEDYKKAVAPEK